MTYKEGGGGVAGGPRLTCLTSYKKDGSGQSVWLRI
jgi:hypothetical protein